MFTGNLIMCPVACDAFRTGISGRTLAIPIAGTPPVAPSREARAESISARLRALIGRGRGKRFAPQAPELAQVADVRLPAPIGHRLLREPNRVVVSIDQLVDKRHQVLGQLHQLAIAVAGSAASIPTGMDWATQGPAPGKAMIPHARVTEVAPWPFNDSGVASKCSTISAAVRCAASRSP